MASKQEYTAAANAVVAKLGGLTASLGFFEKEMVHKYLTADIINSFAVAAVDAAEKERVSEIRP
jgi:hypothetical protein